MESERSASRCGIASCPCQDGDPCHYEDHGGTKAILRPVPTEEVMTAYEMDRRLSGWEMRDTNGEGPWSIERIFTDHTTLNPEPVHQVLVSGIADYRMARLVESTLESAQVALALAINSHAAS